ncbi:MAG: hypothetical protein RXO54_04165 [Acidilobus sp.]
MSVWYNQPLINVVYDALKELTQNGKVPVTDGQLLSYLLKNGYSISSVDLMKTLLRLEIMGLVHVSSSTKEDRQIELINRGGPQEAAHEKG